MDDGGDDRSIDRFRRSGGDEYKVGDEIIVSTADTIIKQDLFQIEIASRADTLMREKKRLAHLARYLMLMAINPGLLSTRRVVPYNGLVQSSHSQRHGKTGDR